MIQISKCCFVLVTFLFCLSHAYPDSAASRTQYRSSTSSSKSFLTGWSLVIPSFVVHGLRPTAEASADMPRKIDKNGDAVMTPGFGFKYEGREGDLFVAGLVKDCYDHLAGTLQYGFYRKYSNLTRWGLTFGVYVRETPLACSTSQFGLDQITECHPMDQYDLKFNALVNGEGIDIIPMPFFHYSTALYKDKDLQINFKVMTNLVLNEFGIAVPF